MSEEPTTSPETTPGGSRTRLRFRRKAAPDGDAPAGRSRRGWRSTVAIGAAIVLAATAGTGVLVQTAVGLQQASLAETRELAAVGRPEAAKLGVYDTVLEVQASKEAAATIEDADRLIREARGKSDASKLASTTAALRGFGKLGSDRVLELVDAARAHMSGLRRSIADFDRRAAEQAAAERAAAERAAAEAAAAEQAAAEEAAEAAPAPPPAAAPAPPASPSDAQIIARDMSAARYGWGQDQFGCLVAVWDYESGWNVTAGTPDGAYGIPQALPGTKMASAGADWQTSAATQISWGLDYIAGRYGNPCAAWAHIEAEGWY
ncbi:lytic transglycosylase domain-containing protein [Agromyces archimandritae]|uniref:Lytic transglycosylase domain-containing protein n=1 Tax=Agromyces archimandritae TaxID=2781962 RepID=A0A975FQZ3_9MICO|nr:lytic transglycosylase domain-containing protein [Agromyces archimandritae]QTX05611.1 lytic transglycosylase domain-containing protein [Agromyces archimandritae]